MTPCTKNNRANNTAILPNVQTPAISEIWIDVCDIVRSGIRRGYRDPRVLASVACQYSHNHRCRWELPGDPADQFLAAHMVGFEVVRHVLGKLEGVA